MDSGIDSDNHQGDPAGFINNFEFWQLVINSGAHISLVDVIDNGNRNGPNGVAEALYVNRLVFEDTTGRLNLNGLHLYYNELVDGDISQIIDLPQLLGDLNCDGEIDEYDIDAFVLALVSPGEYSSTYYLTVEYERRL